MGRWIFRRRVPDAVETVQDEASAGAETEDDVVAWLDLPPDFKAPDVDPGAYRSSNTFDVNCLNDGSDEAKWSAYMSQD
jgi:hypothetical protein